ncbi:hypothetical protein [Thalassotalea hakodatensis]|uniref:hypothetical protein n=1 Tax=Thalassotalea hakodatensis TaxID=3030492 RepID=UPI0025732FD5|nr:hypothetical protein [Thalassotalea hakodatensis]
MANKIDTKFTLQVKALLNKLYGRSVLKDSLLEQAIEFYEKQPFYQHKLDNLTQQINELNTQNGDASAKRQLDKLEREYRDIKQEFKFESNDRYKYLYNICKEILSLTEGATFAETIRKSAQMLGTIQLLCPTVGKRVAEVNERSKPLYKSVLTLRLLDQLCIDKAMVANDGHVKSVLGALSGDAFKTMQELDKDTHEAFIENVKIPVVMASLLQDIGHFHPEAQRIVKGADGTLDPHRTLPVEERKALLQINYRETVKFLIDGIGAPIYVGNSKADRDKFNVAEHKKLIFIKHLLKSAIAPKLGVGNLIKVPQIYTSIILSTKDSYNYKLLPKVYQALNQNAERGTCSPLVVDTLRKITGDFPQGFGVTFIPKDSDGKSGDHYEYAIVNQLYPKDPKHPLCRAATRGLTFISHGQDIEIVDDISLYNTDTAKKFAALSKDRLNEILEKLASNYQERKQLDLLPRCWHAGEFFGLPNHQKLWNKTAN